MSDQDKPSPVLSELAGVRRIDTANAALDARTRLREYNRIADERDARLACVEIAMRNGWLDLSMGEMLAFIRVGEPDHRLRLKCLVLAGSHQIRDQAHLLERASGMFDIVTEADNG